MDKARVDSKERGGGSSPNTSEAHNSDPRSRPRGSPDTAQIGRLVYRLRDGLVTLFVWIGQAICRGFRVVSALLSWAMVVAGTGDRRLVKEEMPLVMRTATGCWLSRDEDLAAHGDHLVSTGTMPIIYVYESEVRTMAGICALWGGLEAGGEYFGLQTRDGHIVVYLVTGPGPNAIHEVAYFRQDIEFFRRVRGIIGRSYVLEIEGFFHGHHGLGLCGPSSFDVEQLLGMARRNRLRRWSEIVASSVDGHRSTFRAGPRLNGPPWRCDCPRIRLKGFFYTDPQMGQKTEVPLRILPGISPFRTMALAGGQLQPEDLGAYACSFPVENIVFDSDAPSASYSAEASALFERLGQECQELPSELQNGIHVRTADSDVVVTLVGPHNKMLRIVYSEKPPYLLRGVFLHHRRSPRPQDVTRMVPGGPQGATLKDICRAVL